MVKVTHELSKTMNYVTYNNTGFTFSSAFNVAIHTFFSAENVVVYDFSTGDFHGR